MVTGGRPVYRDRLIRSGEISQVLDAQLGNGFAANVADVIKQGPGSIYSAVVSSQFDADRLDYMRRDRLMTGTQHGAIDFDWLIANLEVGSVPYGVDEKQIGEVMLCLIPSPPGLTKMSFYDLHEQSCRMEHTKTVSESRMRRARIDKLRKPELLHSS